MAEQRNECPTCTQSEKPTALQFAEQAIGLTGTEQARQLRFHPEYDRGWMSGVEYDLNDSSTPSDTDDIDATKAWLLGFVSGQFSAVEDTPTAFCNDPEHEGSGEWVMVKDPNLQEDDDEPAQPQASAAESAGETEQAQPQAGDTLGGGETDGPTNVPGNAKGQN
jgi:hypothetical protein